MTNKELIEKVIAVFETNDADGIADCITDDFEWHMRNEAPIIGKENMKQFFIAHADMKILNTTIDHFILDGDKVAVDGFIECTSVTGKNIQMFYCDIYDIREGKIKTLTTYAVEKKK